MPKFSFRTNFNSLLAGLLFLQVGGGMISYLLYGPYYSPDTVNYFSFSQHLGKESRWISIYSPAYPFLLYGITVTGTSLFKAAHLLIVVQYGIGSYFLHRVVKITSAHYGFSLKKQSSLLMLLLLVIHSWWSFRILSWAHADSTFYCLLLGWTYFLSRGYLDKGFWPLLILSLLSASMIWVKLNALALIPFYTLLIVLDKDRNKWLAPFGMTTASYFGYRYLSHYQFLDSDALDSAPGLNLLSTESLHLMANNLAELFKSTSGFFVSDFLTAYIPTSAATIGGGILLLLLVWLASKEIKSGLSLSSLLLFFGLTYLLCLLAFLQMIGSEEINYRTLFPYFLCGGAYGMIQLFRRDKTPVVTIFLAGLLICGHTLVGHLWLWQRTEVNSLFEVERLKKSDMMEKIQSLHEGPFQEGLFVSDRPEKLALLLMDPYVVHYDPDFAFTQGKRRPVADQKKRSNRAEIKQKLTKGMMVVVLFGEDQSLVSFAQKNGVLVLKYPEGSVFHQK